MPMKRYRSLFISDVHLGTKSARADLLLDFLSRHEADTLYLVGDIVDFWRIRRGAAWPQSHNDVLQQILIKIRTGTRVIFIPGNHDEGLRNYCGTRFGDIEICRDAIHETLDGRRYLVMHGDEYDVVMRHARWLAFLGDRGYAFTLALNIPINWTRKRLGLDYWSLSAYLKNRVKNAVSNMGDFEEALADQAARRQVDGVICGHIHRVASRKIGDVHYLNTGDWVESCTAIGETGEGSFEIIDWCKSADTRRTNEQPLEQLGEAA